MSNSRASNPVPDSHSLPRESPPRAVRSRDECEAEAHVLLSGSPVAARLAALGEAVVELPATLPASGTKARGRRTPQHRGLCCLSRQAAAMNPLKKLSGDG
eukprot:scaffold228284_cov36-Tisochrysis_lutea.AAC.3